jgi:hypothetical protein
MFQYHSMQLAGFVFQACSIDHFDISPYLESITYGLTSANWRDAMNLTLGLARKEVFNGLIPLKCGPQ